MNRREHNPMYSLSPGHLTHAQRFATRTISDDRRHPRPLKCLNLSTNILSPRQVSVTKCCIDPVKMPTCSQWPSEGLSGFRGIGLYETPVAAAQI